MIKANTTVKAGGKTYTTGQTITGLSKLDKAWMKEAGYIFETIAPKAKNPKEECTDGSEAGEL